MRRNRAAMASVILLLIIGIICVCLALQTLPEKDRRTKSPTVDIRCAANDRFCKEMKANRTAGGNK